MKKLLSCLALALVLTGCDGVTFVKNEFTDNGYELHATFDVDLLAKALGAEATDEMNLEAFVEGMEESGMTCK